MLQDLTRMAAEHGLRFVADKSLAGKKTGVKFERSDVIYVSPAMFELIQTDSEAVLSTLKVDVLPGKGKRKRSLGGEV